MDEVNFGFKKVKADLKQKLVNQVFDSVHKKYDIMNDLMSLGVHRIWKNDFLGQINDFSGRLLDVASGSGDIALRYCQHAKSQSIEPEVVLCDINHSMLQEARKKLIDHGFFHKLSFITSNAEQLSFDDKSFDYYTIAFGLRNCTDFNAVLREAYRVLKPGGKFLCLEFSKVTNPVLSKLYNCYAGKIIPMLGEFVADDRSSYQYLVESIEVFPNQEELKEMINKAGFAMSKYINLSQGVVAIHIGYKL